MLHAALSMFTGNGSYGTSTRSMKKSKAAGSPTDTYIGKWYDGTPAPTSAVPLVAVQNERNQGGGPTPYTKGQPASMAYLDYRAKNFDNLPAIRGQRFKKAPAYQSTTFVDVPYGVVGSKEAYFEKRNAFHNQALRRLGGKPMMIEPWHTPNNGRTYTTQQLYAPRAPSIHTIGEPAPEPHKMYRGY